jgi:hypothetical protein
MSTIAEAIALIFFSVDRGNGLLMSIMRYGILSTLEIVTSFFLIKKFMDSLKDGKFSFMELFFTLIYFIFNVGTTYILLICYLESIGAITFNYDPTSWTMIKSVQGTNTRVEISAVVLIVSTLFFNCALMYFHWRKINDDKIDKKYGKQGNLFDKEQNKKDRENGVGVNERMDKRAEQEKK